MTPMNNNERGRVTGMPGTETTVTLHPQRLGVRMRNSIIRMLESRVLEGGWSSQSRKIAEALAEKHGLQVSTNNWNGIRIRGITKEAAPIVKGLTQADWTAWILENPEYNKGYYRNHFDLAIKEIERLNQNFFITMHDKDSIRQIRETLVTHTPQEIKDRAMQVANLLRGTEPIHITTFRS
jgi:hypothetical protein